MKLHDFDYILPKELIAQEPAFKRDQSRLLVLNLKKDSIKHLVFNQITEILKPGDLVILNNTRVVNARLFGHKSTGGKVELLILEPFSSIIGEDKDVSIIECLIKGKVKVGSIIDIDIEIPNTSNHSLKSLKVKAKVIQHIDGGKFRIELKSSLSVTELLDKYGSLPLPPYIKKDLDKPDRYQTIFSHINGSVAAPTAGLHFSPELLKKLQDKGIKFGYITLHISYGTFTPVRTDNIIQHRMESEYAIVPKETIELINEVRSSSSGRIVAVGTTTVRTLETLFRVGSKHNDSGSEHNYETRSDKNDESYERCEDIIEIKPWKGKTDLFIYPGFKFRSGIDILITNFHLPKSTLLMLVAAFAGRENILKAYEEAVELKYRFYSLGDSMVIIK
jgi:S-adenosylmethionine:tRNA ribosyltransferase-isomerase